MVLIEYRKFSVIFVTERSALRLGPIILEVSAAERSSGLVVRFLAGVLLDAGSGGGARGE